MYSLSMTNDINIKLIEEYLDKILVILKEKIDSFYLAGGTALSRIYFKHRGSYDLDFFTQNFSEHAIEEATKTIQEALNIKVKLKGITDEKGKVQLRTYYAQINEKDSVKIDFVEDTCPLILPTKKVEGVFVLSKEDIYIRKIFAICGSKKEITDEGRNYFIGGRKEAKDYFDIFRLSTIFMPLSEFVLTYCSRTQTIIERLVIWQKTYDRFEMRSGLVDLITPTIPDSRLIEKHFDEEIDKLIIKLIE